MKIALVHELLIMRGGAEKVLRILAEMFPKAPIYTLLYDEKKLGNWFSRERVRFSTLQKWADLNPLPHRYNHHLYLRHFPQVVEAWDFSGFDLVISSSSAFAHGIITNGTPKHLCYVHSPARYLWDRTHDVLDRASEGMLGPLKRAHLSRTFHKLRTWDAEAADRPDRLLAASKTVQRRIELYWQRKSTVIYPPIDDCWLQEHPHHQVPHSREYYFVASTLVPYKKIDLAIDACNRRNATLVIAGEGPDRKRLERMAGPTVEFIGYKNEEGLRNLYTNARATIFPGDEDFGLVPLESLACGTPVIAYGSGGALETLSEDTAEFFTERSAEALTEAMGRFERKKWDAEPGMTRASGFSRSLFEQAINREIDTLMK
ncbi:MAG: glycosyltransferase [Candidatus Peribacteraceae bacterium]|jgi:glycosyltransferase involved in cell wall biosynthesis